jgi:hypothetical protein
VPTEVATEICDGLDNDCNGQVDDVDAEDDGIRDCIDILLIGAPGLNSASSFQTWLASKGVTVQRIHGSGSPPELVRTDLEAFDVVVIDRLLRSYSAVEAGMLASWVGDGGGLLSMNGHTGSSDRQSGNSLLSGIGVEHLAGLRNGPVTSFLAPHPLTGGLTSVTFQGGYALGLLPDAGTGFVTVADIGGAAVGIAVEAGRGRAFVWGDEWIQFDSEWSAQPQIQQFWVNAFAWLTRAS